ncbi:MULTISPECIES: Rv3235 family protein [unclassified Mycobacterium]|uniref:Rv3235 family protein n=1 Tax=unclassified Mycobacterium TaxID=2642494 RepID=UPI0027421196|nr:MULTISPECIES: Rv3235 family protein [unclassified Mycobacterium]MDP7703543.1 Rv3235 family protein [Mycobacterium sp. TY815]MDP7722026.1 Rv3235 family protein [Mycobacterium sp. TY814]
MPVSDTAVTPVIDYEPPTHLPGPDAPRCLPTAAAPAARARPHPAPKTPLSPRMRQAATFADAALRRVLEVIDRRRPAAQLGAVLAPYLVDAVVAVSRAAAGTTGAAVLRRMRVQPALGDDAAEVFGSYSRGERVHAIACRVERLPPGRWLVVALHIG